MKDITNENIYKLDRSKSKNFYGMKISTTKVWRDQLSKKKYIKNNKVAYIIHGTTVGQMKKPWFDIPKLQVVVKVKHGIHGKSSHMLMLFQIHMKKYQHSVEG